VSKLLTVVTIAVYLAAIVAANLITTEFGPEASIYNAFFLIGLTLVVRDVLHDLWDRHRFIKMAALIGAGAGLSYLLNQDASQIALASCIAFASAEGTDAVVYHGFRRWPWLERSNISNFGGALVDSAVFVAIAFPGFLWEIAFAQFVAKVAGGLLFSLLLQHRRGQRAPARAG
jgi:hypothetical protein